MNSWIKSHEAAVITGTSAFGTLIASLVGVNDLTTLATFGATVGSVAHIVDRVIQVFVSNLGDHS